MKLRLHDNTLRLRLSQTDVAAFQAKGFVEENVTFAGNRILTYRIESSGAENLDATLDGSRITVNVPKAVAKGWAESDQVGIESASGGLNILIEKDFQCLHEDAPEDAAAFPNPAVASRRD
jgi:hypothetical protein